MARSVKPPWVLNGPPDALACADVQHAMLELGYNIDDFSFVDQRHPVFGHWVDRIAVLPHDVTVNSARSMPQQMRYHGISRDGKFAEYWNPQFGTFDVRGPGMLYQLELLPPLPRQVAQDAIAFTRRRPAPGARLPPQPRGWREMLRQLARGGRGHWPTMQ